MNNASELPSKLKFLANYFDSDLPRYREAHWLDCDFDSPIWTIRLKSTVVLDWQVRVGGSTCLLTDSKNAPLLTALKSWLVIQTHSDWTGRLISAPITEMASLGRAIHTVDYLLLRADALQLADHGLKAITANDVRAILSDIGSNHAVSTSVYQWPQRLTAFLRRQGQELRETELDALLTKKPFLAENIIRSEDFLTDLAAEEVVRARAWLWRERFYSEVENPEGYRYSPNTAPLARALYADTLNGSRTFLPVPDELKLVPNHHVVREFPRARVRSERGDRMNRELLRQYCNTFASFALLPTEGLYSKNLQEDLRRLYRTSDFKAEGRFRTLPHLVVLPLLKAAIEFVLKYGDALVDSYVKLASAANEAQQTIGEFSYRNDIRQFLHPDAVELGVRRWAIEWSGLPKLEGPEYYSQLRQNVGLWESMRVLYGAGQTIIGALMARRQGELIDLIAGSCLDTSRTMLVFSNRKSGIAGVREVEARPIPPVGVEVVTLLERLQSSLIANGLLERTTNLFAHPTNRGKNALRKLSEVYFNSALDYFCDWAQTPLDNEGKRYYVRQHQLRRFFCMLFFWGSSFGGLETLRWFLGHTDAAHLWHYITESTPGVAVRSVAAQWAAYGVQHNAPETEALASLLKDHFGTPSFEVIAEESLESYIEDLMDEGRVTIEPEFLDGGEQYRIAVVVRAKEETC